MAICIISYLFLLILFFFRKKLPVPKEVFLLFLAGNTLAFCLFCVEAGRGDRVEKISRSAAGAGTRVEELTARVEGEKEVLLNVSVSEKKYNEEELQEIFSEVTKQLDVLILGANESFDHIDQDMNLVKSVDQYPVQIEWILSDYQVLDPEGTLREDFHTEEGVLLELQAHLTCQGAEALYVRNAMIYPPREEQLSVEERLHKLLREEDETSEREDNLILPKQLGDREITWSKPSGNTGYLVWILGVLVAVLWVFRKKEKEKEEVKKREEELLSDYPKIVSTFTLLLETGMTAKNAWTKIAQNYEKNKTKSGPRAAYEEMCESCRMMQSGVSEKEAYERYGNQCGLMKYRKWGALLSRNLRKGSKGLAEILLMETMQAAEEQKSRTRQKAEEAGTKLLLPMFAMLGVVLLMIMIPAFMTMQI